MSKRTGKEKWENGLLKAGIKWEYLRNNRDYKKDYKDYVEVYRKMFEKNKAKVECIEKFRAEKFRRFSNKYGVAIPIDPDISFLKLVHAKLEKRKNSNVLRITSDRFCKKNFNKSLKKDQTRFRKDMCSYKKRNKNNTKRFPGYYSGLWLPPDPRAPYYLSGQYKAMFLACLKSNLFVQDSPAVISLEEIDVCARNNCGDNGNVENLATKTIQAQVDFSKPLSKIVREIGFHFSTFYKVFNKNDFQPKFRFDEHKRYIELGSSWDKGEPLCKLAKIYHNGNEGYARRDYAIYNKFVGGGYMQIR